jgi:glutathione peroxidase
MRIYQFEAQTLDGQPALSPQHQGQVMLIVDTANKGGVTPQYERLEALFRDCPARGFSMLGFACNRFGAQEPDDAAKIANLCSMGQTPTPPMPT